MSENSQVLHLRIEQNGSVVHRYVQEKSPFYVGKNAGNDLALRGDGLPKRHPLFLQKGRRYFLLLPSFAEGEVKAKNSRLRFNDLIEHELLPRGNGYHTYEIKPGRMGYIFLDSVRIDFLIERKKAAPPPPREILDFDGFKPAKVFWKHLKEDGAFKGMVAFLIIVNSLALYGLRDYVPPPKKKAAIEAVTRRLARFVINTPAPEPEPPKVAKLSNRTEAENTEPETPETKSPEPKKKAPEPPKKRRNPSQLGVLALLTGTGEANKSNSVINQLLKADLATSVENTVSSGRLQVGKSGNGESKTEEVLDLLAEGGIDDLIGEIGGDPESISLSGKGTIEIESLGEVSGSQEAIGARSETSLRDVLQKNMGRLTYIYNKYLRRNPEFRGLMRVEVTIDASGRVSEVVLVSSNMNNPDFEHEVMAAIRKFKYEPIETGSLKVQYPLSFFRQ